MNRLIAVAAQRVGQFTVLVALISLLWRWVDLAGSNDTGFPSFPGQQNMYLLELSSAANLAVFGMLAIGLGMMLERAMQ